MSFILDALKKSESARQDTNAPGIADVPVLQRRAGTPRWVPVVAVLLGVNLLAVLYLVLRPDAAPPTQATRAPMERIEAATLAPAAVASPVAARAEATVIASQPAPPPAMRPAAVTDDGRNRVTESSQSAGMESPAPALPTATTPPPEPVAEPPQDEAWLTFAEVRASGSLGLPDMHIDLHVYSDNPAERFVFINMTEYRERDTTTEGPTLRNITPEGVLLEYRGSTFLLPRD